MIHCQICQSEARPAKFRSPRLRICQWCVTFLCEEPIDPVEIEHNFNTKINTYVERTLKFPDVSFYRHAASFKVEPGIHPGFFELIFKRALVAQRKLEREQKIEMIADQLRLADIERVNRERATLRAATIERALSRINPPQLVTSGYRSRGKKVDLIDPTMIKYMNAIRYKLISGKAKSERPTPEEWEELRQIILKEDKYLCRICRTESKEKHVHHIVPLSKYGSNHQTNLITLCYDCHNKVHPDFQVTRNVR